MTSSSTAPAARRGTRRRARGHGSERALSADEKRVTAILGVPTLALALAVTLVTTYLPVIAREFVGSRLVIGLIVGIEGLIALWLPLLAGAWSDRLRTPLGGRLPFLLAATPLLLVGLGAMGAVRSVGTLLPAVLVFFLGYFLAYEPYRALYPDAVGDDAAGRAQGTQALWRGTGTGVALLGGGLLLGLGQAVPFLAAGVVYVAAMVVFTIALVRRGIPDRRPPDAEGAREQARRIRDLVRGNPALQSFLAANALWELSLAALKTFVVLYVTAGLGHSRPFAALVIGGVAILVLAAAVRAGKLGDRVGRLAVVQVALPVYGLGLLVPFLSATPLLVALSVPFIAVGGGVIMAMPYAILMPLMPEQQHGALTGYYSLSRGLGTWLGPLLGGVAIEALGGVFPATEGYQAVWGVCSAAVLLSLLPLRRLRATAPAEEEGDRSDAGTRRAHGTASARD
jgi:MFS family permease